MYWFEFTFKKTRTKAAHAACVARLDPFCRSLQAVLPTGWLWSDWDVDQKLTRVAFDVDHVATGEEADRVEALLTSSGII